MKKLAIFLYYVVFLGSLQAQSVFSFEQIGLKSDSLPKQLVEYFDPGERGTDLLWDFSGQLRSNVVQPVVYHSDSLGRISAIGKGLLCRYRLKTDTLFLIESSKFEYEPNTYNKHLTHDRQSMVNSYGIGGAKN